MREKKEWREGGREERIRRKATKKRGENIDVCIVFDFFVFGYLYSLK